MNTAMVMAVKMQRRGDRLTPRALLRRPPSLAVLAIRSAIALAALVAACGAGFQAWTLAAGRDDGAGAGMCATLPVDARIAGRCALRAVTPEASIADRAAARRLALGALRKDPTAVDAVIALGMDAALDNDAGTARRYFGYAETLSRREIQTQLWSIEDAVSRDDIPGALRHYDIALRRSIPAREILFPILASALVEVDVRAGLVRTFAARPRWGGAFLFDAARRGSEPEATATFFAALASARIPPPESASAVLIDTLLARGFVDPAWAYYASMRTGADRRRSRDPSFAAELTSRAAFDWQTLGQAGVFTSIEHSEGGSVFAFSVPSGGNGLLLRQMQLLPPGRYALSGHALGIAQPVSARPYWQLLCQNGRELGRVPLPGPTESRAAFGGTFAVPTDCPVQYLSLIAKPSDTNANVDGEVYDAVLAPAE